MDWHPDIAYGFDFMRPWIAPGQRRWRYGVLLAAGRFVGEPMAASPPRLIHKFIDKGRARWHELGPQIAAGSTPTIILCETRPPTRDRQLPEWVGFHCPDCGRKLGDVNRDGMVYLWGLGGHTRLHASTAHIAAGPAILVLPGLTPNDLPALAATIPGAVLITEATPTQALVQLPEGTDLRGCDARLREAGFVRGPEADIRHGFEIVIFCDRYKVGGTWEFGLLPGWAVWKRVRKNHETV